MLQDGQWLSALADPRSLTSFLRPLGWSTACGVGLLLPSHLVTLALRPLRDVTSLHPHILHTHPFIRWPPGHPLASPSCLGPSACGHVAVSPGLVSGQVPGLGGTHLAVGTDEEGLHLEALADHGHGGAGGDGGSIAGGGGDDGIGHPGAAQGRGDGSGLGEGLGLAAGRWHMADGIVGGGEGWARVLDADHSGLLECWGLLGWPVPARGDGEAVWNQSLWPNLGESDRCTVRQTDGHSR